MPVTATLPRLLHSYFHGWLAGQRNIASHTIMSYRDTWRLFLRFGERYANYRLVTIPNTAEGSHSSQVTDLPLIGQPV